MSEKKWTEQQIQAINTDHRSILVSAAAGSGKTACLAERVIRKITRKDNPVDADKLLIVTFTKAAAAEMRERISNLLSGMIKKNPQDENLIRQKSLLRNAYICTIDSFCNNLLREKFYRFENICSNFKIADEKEISFFEKTAMENVLNKFYENSFKKKNEKDEYDDFLNFVESFSTEKNDSKIVDLILKSYKFTRSLPFAKDWLKDKINLFSKEYENIFNSPWGESIFEYANIILEYCENLLDLAFKNMEKSENLKNKYFEIIDSYKDNVNEIKKALISKSWDDVFKKVNDTNIKINRFKGDFYFEIMKQITKKYKKLICNDLKSVFFKSEKDCKDELKNFSRVAKMVFTVTLEFIDEISRIKSEKNVLEIGDLQHLTLKLLTKKDKFGNISKSDEAKELSLLYDEIIVDEYQDINEVQDLIFKMISKDENNLFMVGDVKQSIYGFRGSRPEIFMEKKDRYLDINKINENFSNEACKIILSKNFRSCGSILETVNFFFRQLMNKKISGMQYKDEDALYLGANTYSEADCKTVFEFINYDKKNENECEAEAKKISEIISKMINEKYMIYDSNIKRPVTYKDFCILLRNKKNTSEIYASQLNKAGIPAWADSSGKFLETYEISTMISLLKVIDNPIQDVPLVSVLMSPIFGFTPGKLGKIRAKNKSVPFYMAIKEAAKNSDEKCANFIKQIDKYRTLSSMVPLENLINKIYDETSFTCTVLSMPNGNQKLANLRLLAEYASRYDLSSIKGLSGFLSFIYELNEKQSDLSPASIVSESSNVVRIMTIHRSKGLEFPICILANCSKKFSQSTNEFFFHQKLGFGAKIIDPKTNLKNESFLKKSIDIEIKKEEAAENLRLLYVAMTRAKQKLICFLSVGKNSSQEKSLDAISYCLQENNFILPYGILSSSCFYDFILPCIAKSKNRELLQYLSEHAEIQDFDYQEIFKNHDFENLSCDFWKFGFSYSSSFKDDITKKEPSENTDVCSISSDIIKRFKFEYPYKNINHIPVKISASALSHSDIFKDYIATSTPDFMNDNEITPTERGTAFHEFLHFADYSLSVSDFDNHLNYLQKKGFLTKKQVMALDKESILKFLLGDLGQRIIKSKEVYKEYRFTVGKNANQLDISDIKQTSTEEKVIIQGAIDCVFRENDGFVLIDYKTDKVNDITLLKSKYKKQLEIYKYAFETCENAKISEMIIYSLFLGKWINI